ncbi:MAG: MarR family transcriptional regulator [Oscillospiraceae bacterium]|nr:MarR family transcriptional regulator [Oscillospiraceae bacterium]
MNEQNFDALKIENQLCFPLYACSREVIKQYKPYLDKMDLTYTQYVVMMALWEEKEMTVKALGDRLYLDSGTLTPLLKKLEAKGYITRTRSRRDERNLLVSVTEIGAALREEAAAMPRAIREHTELSFEETETLYRLLYKILAHVDERNEREAVK